MVQNQKKNLISNGIRHATPNNLKKEMKQPEIGFLSTLFLFIYQFIYMFQIQVPSSVFKTFHITLKVSIFLIFCIYDILEKKNSKNLHVRILIYRSKT
jgi:hypothetical protein